MKQFAFAILGLVAFCGLTLWLKHQVEYQLGQKHLRFKALGMTLKRVPLHRIKRISKRRSGMVANWSNCWQNSHREVILHTDRAMARPILITPRNRYIFIKELERAQEKLGLTTQPSEEEEPAETA